MVRTSSSVRPSDQVEAHLGAAAEIATLIRSVPLLQVATPASSSPPLVLMFYVFMLGTSGCTNYLQLTREPTSSLTRARGVGLRKVRTPASTTWTFVSGVMDELQPDDQNLVFLYNELDDVK